MPELSQIECGIGHFFIQHSSASLTINENADPDVRGDMERYFLHAVPEDAPYFKHVVEGPDDMPAHIKASLLGSSLSVPVANGRLLLGMWQGIWLGEHRIEGGSRTVVISIF
jgi:secondary thiamine-phosphate synthase enzyme